VEPTTDPGLTTDLAEAVGMVLPALERFLRFQDGDLSATEYAQWLAALSESLPEGGAGAVATLEVLAGVVIPHGTPIGAPGFAGWVTTMPTVVPAVAALSASIAGAQRWWLQSYNFLEHLSLEWLKELLGLPPSYQGTFTSGGSVANLIALGAARQWACELQGIDASADGLGALGGPRIYASNQGHHVLRRAAALLGLGRRGLVEMPTDDAFRLDVNALRDQVRRDRRQGCTPIAVVATAGTVNTGAIDPLRDILQLCREERIWLHVDGAYGGFGILDPEVCALFEGLSQADSLAVDPHKWLAVPLGCGAAFVRDRDLLRRAFTLDPAEYLEGSARQPESIRSQFDSLGYLFHDFNLEQSARSRGVTVWAALKEIGAEGMRARVRAHNAFARRLAARVRASPNLELLAPVTLSICCFRYVPAGLRGRSGAAPLLNELNREILARLHSEHRYFPSSTELNGSFVLRPCYINPRTTAAEVDGLIDAVERLGARVCAEQQAGSTLGQ
jgi:aromatic-L-amino-acid decarboxylase